MPQFRTVQDGMDYCAKKFPDNWHSTVTQGFHMPHLVSLTLMTDVGIFAAGWILGRWGWDVVVSWIKAAYTKVAGATSTAVTEVKTVV